ncbi:hypothetical protein [Paenibacillus sp. Soil724D2]|uniref:hypothetical protein n=1 Tax=Paenibacillus sp. (strain Soil724D2) TaxID=1736392 RepID=UPI00071244AF|nr:hypothetical protein [Paenibacillus sp. Soil724D2]KRE48305.1 hypothetical protein ASG85_04680 [Paenibacillus sp. Soil724D2]
MTEKKRLSKKEKVIATVVSTAIATIPFFVGMPTYEVAAANGTEEPEPVDQIHDLVIPKNSTIINLRDLFHLSEESTFSVLNGTNPLIETNFLDKGFLKVKGGVTGKASFTVTFEDYDNESGEYHTIEESFNVAVVPSESTGKINIGNLVTYMSGLPEDFESAEQVKQLLTGISPSIVDVNHGEGTTKLLIKPFPDVVTINKNSSIPISSVYDLHEYFHYSYGEGEGEGEGLNFYVFSSNEDIVDVFNDGDWYLSSSDQTGGVDITIVAVNERGDMGYDTFHATVLAENQAPEIGESLHKSYHISPGSSFELDLNHYFSDSLGDLTFSKILTSGSNGSSEIYGSKLYLHPNMENISEIRGVKATDGVGLEVSQPFTVTSSTYNPFEYQTIFVGSTLDINLTDAFGTSTPLNYTFDYNDDSVTVSSVVYNSQNYLRLSGLGEYYFPSSSKLKVNAVNSATDEAYVDTLGLNHSIFNGFLNISSLFPIEIESGKVIQVSSSNSNMPMIPSGSNYFVNGSGTTTITVDVDHGKKILTIPYTTPPILP